MKKIKAWRKHRTTDLFTWENIPASTNSPKAEKKKMPQKKPKTLTNCNQEKSLFFTYLR